jgi:predicted ATP-dependent protease
VVVGSGREQMRYGMSEPEDSPAERSSIEPLPADRLRRACDPASLGFATTSELKDLDEIIGQDRAVEAVRLAVGTRRPGYNLFALGPEGVGRQTLLHASLTRQAAEDPTPDDLCYVFDFSRPHRPQAIRLPPGRGRELLADMERLSAELRTAIPAAFDSDGYRARREALDKEFEPRRDQAIAEVDGRAREQNLAVVRTPLGTGVVPLRNGEPIESDDFRKLPKPEQEHLKQAIEAIQNELEGVLHQVQRWERDHRERIRQLDRDTTRAAVDHLLIELRARYGDVPAVIAYLAAVEADVVDNAAELIAAQSSADGGQLTMRAIASEAASFHHYRVNLLIDHADTSGAPVVVENNPTYGNLIGRIEHMAQLGALVTDFTLIKPGALHRANGGYLVLEARQVLTQPFAWDALKRAIRSRELRIEEIGQVYGLISTVSLEPEPVPLDVKVALIGDRVLYFLLSELDPDFPELFKIQADFNEDVDRTVDTDRLLARLLATLARREGIRALDAAATARVIEHAARSAGDADKLSIRIGVLGDLLREAEESADHDGHATLTAADVERAIEGRERRASRVRDLVQEHIERGTIRIETTGSRVGQANGLSVASFGDVPFGWPTRITARVGLGSGEVVDIERQVELGGPIHSKGVMILEGFMTGRYAVDEPLTLTASLVFEQSYGPVEGDSASLAELCVMLSALADTPLRQSLAVTGSIDQFGNTQAIGAVNEKVEGFFDVCSATGLTGEQGVVIPRANIHHLMLRRDVVAAVDAGRFNVYPVDDVDQTMGLLTGLPAGERSAKGRYPARSVNGLVARRLASFATASRRFIAPAARSGRGRAPGRTGRRTSG